MPAATSMCLGKSNPHPHLFGDVVLPGGLRSIHHACRRATHFFQPLPSQVGREESAEHLSTGAFCFFFFFTVNRWS